MTEDGGRGRCVMLLQPISLGEVALCYFKGSHSVRVGVGACKSLTAGLGCVAYTHGFFCKS
jgi:hypothetical protein